MGYVFGEIMTTEAVKAALELNEDKFREFMRERIDVELALRCDLDLIGNAYWVVRDGVKVRITPDDVAINGTDYVVRDGEELMHAMVSARSGLVGVSPIKASRPIGMLGLKPGVVFIDDCDTEYIDGRDYDDTVRDLDTKFGKAHLEMLDHVPGVLRNVSRETNGGDGVDG